MVLAMLTDNFVVSVCSSLLRSSAWEAARQPLCIAIQQLQRTWSVRLHLHSSLTAMSMALNPGPSDELFFQTQRQIQDLKWKIRMKKDFFWKEHNWGLSSFQIQAEEIKLNNLGKSPSIWVPFEKSCYIQLWSDLWTNFCSDEQRMWAE